VESDRFADVWREFVEGSGLCHHRKVKALGDKLPIAFAEAAIASVPSCCAIIQPRVAAVALVGGKTSGG